MRLTPTTRRLLVAVAVAVVAAPWAVVARTLVNAKPVETGSTVAARSIAWGSRVFSTKADLAAWLRSRGASYSVWATRHPGDRAILEHTTTTATGGSAQAAATGSGATSANSGETATPRASAGPPASSTSGSSVSWLTVALLAIASTTMLAALVPSALPVLGEDVRLTETHRAYLFAAGLAVSVGVLVAGVLS